MSTIVYCSGQIVEAQFQGQPIVGSVSCPSGWITAAYVPPFDVSQIDPLVMSEFFGAGFVLFITPYAAAWALSILLKPLRS
jgi:hypothetical protein